MLKSGLRSGAATMILISMGAWIASAQSPRLVPPSTTRTTPAQPAAPAAIATVGGRLIPRDEFRARESQAMNEYRTRLGQDVPEEVKPVVRRQLLESLIRRELLVLEATRRGILGTDAEAEAELRKESFFNPNGRFDPQRWEAIRTTQPAQFSQALQSIKQQLGARKLGDRLERDFSGDAGSLRSTAGRNLSRATVDVLPIRRVEVDGLAREPREMEVVQAWRAGGERWRRPAEARLTVLLVDQPPLPDGVDPGGPEGLAWRNRLRQRADSALAAARGGARFEDIAQEVGSVRTDVTVTPENFPGYWRGEPRENAAVFAARAGSLVPTPIAAGRGWMVVRVEEQKPERLAPLSEVAREIRGALRAEAKSHGQDRELRAIYDRDKSRFRTTAWRLRYAAYDTSTAVGEPSAAELDRWYRAHQADFSRFDAQAGSIQVRPLAEVRDLAITRWKSERRREAARFASLELQEGWQKKSRPRDLERRAREMREIGPIIPGAPLDTSAAARTLADTLARRPWGLRTATIPWSSGWIVYQVYERVPDYAPPFEQVRIQLANEQSEKRSQEEEAAARALFDKDPMRFAARNVIHYTRLLLEKPNPLELPLTRATVERYYRDHLDRYSAPEQVRVRHILVAADPSNARAFESAREKAQSLLERARKGEDFAELAKKNSDDVATREKGGDLGDFTRGTMLPQIEEVAFRLKPGQLSDPIRSEVGWHLLLGVSYLPIYAQELRYVYANVGWDAAQELADSVVVRRGDSLAAAVRTPAQGRAAAAKLKATLDRTYHEIGDRRGPAEIVSFFIRLENTKPGQMVPGRGFDRAIGNFVAWVDSVSPARQREWHQARPAALDAYRRGASQRALDQKKAELDSLLAAGWSADSLAALWGGWERVSDLQPGMGVSGMGGSSITDSLIFGAGTKPALEEMKLSGWVDLPGGIARLRVRERAAADASRVAATVENEKRIQTEQKMVAFFEDLKKRWPVRIHDERLRDTPLPPPPSSKLR